MFISTVVGILAGDGLVSLDAPVASRWRCGACRTRATSTQQACPSKAARQKRIGIMAELERIARWLTLTEPAREASIENDPAIDAFLSALVACVATMSQTIAPLLEQRAAAQREGWIPSACPGLARRPSAPGDLKPPA
jgi:hypothetical protein